MISRLGKRGVFSIGAVAGLLLLLGVALGQLSGTTVSLASAPPQETGTAAPVITLPNFADIAERVNPAVVYIESTEVVRPGEGGRNQFRDPFWDFFFGPDRQSPEQQQPQREQERTGRGSGVVIDREGFILTNNHMVEGAEKVTVEFADGTRIKAEVVGTDPPTDLALIKIDPRGEIPFVPLGDSDALRIGEWVMAIGNPHNFKHTVSVGVVSALGRKLPYLSDRDGGGRDISLDNFIQTDAAINFGNSGGPLINTRGEIVGINTAISAAAQNIGFAVPVNVARDIMPQLKEKGRVSRGYLGIKVTAVTPEMQELFNLPDRQGAIVQEVVTGLPADQAGLKHGDVIRQVNGKPVADSSDLVTLVSSIPPGETVNLKVFRDGKTMKIGVMLAERDEETGIEEARKQARVEEDLLGLTVQQLNPALRERYRIAEMVTGVVVVAVKPLSPAGEADIREGDVIGEIFREKVDSIDSYKAELEKIEEGDLVLLYVHRGADSFFKTLKVVE
jgi:serine protease Do